MYKYIYIYVKKRGFSYMYIYEYVWYGQRIELSRINPQLRREKKEKTNKCTTTLTLAKS